MENNPVNVDQTQFYAPDEEHLSEKQLSELAEKPPSDWPVHAANCEICGGVAKMLQDNTHSDRNLAEFRALVNERAREVEKAYHPSFWNDLRAIFSFGGMKWSMIAASVMTVVMAGSWFWIIKPSSEQKSVVVINAIDEDKNELAIQEARKQTADLQIAKSLSRTERQEGFLALNRKIENLKSQPLTSKQREEVNLLGDQVVAATGPSKLAALPEKNSNKDSESALPTVKPNYQTPPIINSEGNRGVTAANIPDFSKSIITHGNLHWPEVKGQGLHITGLGPSLKKEEEGKAFAVVTASSNERPKALFYHPVAGEKTAVNELYLSISAIFLTFRENKKLIVYLDDSFFEKDQLKNPTKEKMNKLSQTLLAYPGSLRLEIAGRIESESSGSSGEIASAGKSVENEPHKTSASGIGDHQQQTDKLLGPKRAKAVHSYLVQAGMNVESVKIAIAPDKPTGSGLAGLARYLQTNTRITIILDDRK